MNQENSLPVSREDPIYNIGIVSRMTGVSMATLRVWEKRYQFPDSERTVGGHRLYSEKDVLRLRWVKARIDEGMQTAQAIHALQRQEQDGSLALVEPFLVQPDKAPLVAPMHLSVGAERLLQALINRDLVAADSILGEAMVLSSPEAIILEVISPVMRQIGEAWEQGKINIAVEHLGTNYLRQRLLMWMLSGPPTKESSPIVLACAPGELHEGSLMILGAILRRQGLPICYLGQSMPLPDLAEFVGLLHPRLVVMVAMTEEAAAQMVEWPKYLDKLPGAKERSFAYGGRVFSLHPEWQARVPGVFLGSSFQEGLDTIQRLLG